MAEWGLAAVVSPDFQGFRVGMLVNNVSAVCLCVLGEGREALRIDQHLCVYCGILH